MGLGALYLSGVWLEAVGSRIPAAVLPRTPLYFLQVAALFPRAATNVIDFRAEGWLCRERRWQEIDTRAYFPLDPDDKENRFQRVMHFFRDNRPTMHALDEFIVSGHAAGRLARADGIAEDVTIGGIRALSLRLPLPEPGAPLTRASRMPLSDYPKSVRKVFYYTPKSKRAERCGYREPATQPQPADDTDEPTAPARTKPTEPDPE
jgi:hypothetical protein